VAQAPSIEDLRELAKLLASDSLSATEFVAKLGDRPVDLQANIIVQEPRLSGVARASVARQTGGGDVPAHVTLDLVEPIALGDLETAFGTPKTVVPDHRGELPHAIFRIELANSEYDVRLIGAIERGGSTVRSLTLARDVKLPA
jgi:hypothetical protein